MINNVNALITDLLGHEVETVYSKQRGIIRVVENSGGGLSFYLEIDGELVYYQYNQVRLIKSEDKTG